jgi:acyl-CoA synthetase (NDP forming)
VSSDGRAGLLAADACAAADLQVAVLGSPTQRELRRMLPPAAVVAGPVDATAAVTPGAFRQCLEQVAADDGVDIVLALIVPAATDLLVPAACAADTGKPIALVALDQPEAVRLLARTPDEPGTVPAYACPESAARALAHAAHYGAWRARPPGHVPEFSDVRSDDAQALIGAFLAGAPDGGWLPPGGAAELLGCYGVRLAPASQATMNQGGTEVTIGVTHEPVFGPLILFGPADIAADAAGDRAVRLSPLTDADADELIRSSSAAPQLLGGRGTSAADLTALAGMLLRISRLADDFPELAELEINPVIARPDGVFAVSARVLVTPAAVADPFLRQLR